MKKLGLPTLACVLAVWGIASFSATPADARENCTLGGWTNLNPSDRPIFRCQQQVSKRMKGSRYAKKARGVRTARLNQGSNHWHGWAGSYHLDGARFPGGNPSGPASYYNNYEGGFHTTAFWILSDRGRY